MVQIAQRPAHKYITRDKADLVTSSNALVSADTGTILPAVQHKAFVPDKKLEGRFDKVCRRLSHVCCSVFCPVCMGWMVGSQ
jgi:hypothetical protein